MERIFQESAWNIKSPINPSKTINRKLDIKLGQFTKEELDWVQKKIKSRKAAGVGEKPAEVSMSKKFDDKLRLCNAVDKQNTIEKWAKGHINVQ